MKSSIIPELAGYLAGNNRSWNEIAQFLSMRILNEEEVICLYLAEILETGVLCPLGSFGYASEDVARFLEISLQDKTPMTKAVSTNEIVCVANTPNSLDEFERIEVLLLNPQWQTLISVPSYPNGGFTFVSKAKIELTEVEHLFLIAVGSLIGLYGQSPTPDLIESARLAKEQTKLAEYPLTPRQLVIAGMLERGFNNAQISLDIGFSESLIRQESVAIYQKLNVSGRKAMQAIHSLNLESAIK
jgi:DNA-binding CsgD family transcriptional regulator